MMGCCWQRYWELCWGWKGRGRGRERTDLCAAAAVRTSWAGAGHSPCKAQEGRCGSLGACHQRGHLRWDQAGASRAAALHPQARPHAARILARCRATCLAARKGGGAHGADVQGRPPSRGPWWWDGWCFGRQRVLGGDCQGAVRVMLQSAPASSSS